MSTPLSNEEALKLVDEQIRFRTSFHWVAAASLPQPDPRDPSSRLNLLKQDSSLKRRAQIPALIAYADDLRPKYGVVDGLLNGGSYE